MKKNEMIPLIILLEQVPVLLLQSANVIHVNGLKLTLELLLVCWQLFVMHGLETDSGVVTNTHHKNATALGTSILVMFFGECNMDLRNVVGRMRGRVRVLKHWLAVTADVEDARPAIVSCFDGQAAGVSLLDVFISRQGAVTQML